VIANPGSSRARRAIGVFAACLLSFEAVGLVPTIGAPPACCCLRMAAQKRVCPVCAHAKEIESGQPVLKTCGLHDTTSLPRATFLPATPAPVAEEVAVARQPLPEDEAVPLVPVPSPDVPTPPPLA
jgi:hypothetical protein